MSHISSRERKAPERFQAWTDAEKHEPFTVRNNKRKMKENDMKVKEYQKEYQAKYRESRKALAENVDKDKAEKGKKAEDRELKLAEKNKKMKEYQEKYKKDIKVKKEEKMIKEKKYQASYRKMKKSC